MKVQLYLTLFITVIFGSCSPNEEEFHNKNAKSIVKDWIKINAEYPNSYKPLKFKKVELVKTFG